MQRLPRSRVVRICAFAVITAFSGLITAQQNPLVDSALNFSTNVIKAASFDYSNNTLIISINLLAGDRVTAVLLAGVSLAFTATSNSISASLPLGRFTPGSYLLEISTTKLNLPLLRPTFDVAYGAIGPQGLIGPQGRPGATGMTGPKGDSGSAGVQGPSGANGSLGQVGPQGPQGAQGPQGQMGAQGLTGLPGIASHAYSAICSSGCPTAPFSGSVTVLSVPVPAGAYILFAKTIISAPIGEGASCQLELQSSLTILDQSSVQLGYAARTAVLINTAATAIAYPDTVLLVCQGDQGYAGVSSGQLIAVQIGALN